MFFSTIVKFGKLQFLSWKISSSKIWKTFPDFSGFEHVFQPLFSPSTPHFFSIHMAFFKTFKRKVHVNLPMPTSKIAFIRI